MITEKEFKKAEAGDFFITGEGDKWPIVKISIEDGRKIVMTETSVGVEDFSWFNGKIMDEEFGIVLELNHPDAKLVKKEK